ncbi:MAG: DNA mismatch endonuclease Vsr [Sphingobacteriales bacterium]|nr:MAG: DNA mismatch endonuclease Vsr [Sphingobacteriales bacterium]
MSDTFDKPTRSRIMASIKGKNTKPEMLIRRGLHFLGFRYRLHNSKLPGSPDLVFAKHRAVIFVNGCFWHGHDCHIFHWPKTRTDFWRTKIERNKQRDTKNLIAYEKMRWKVLIIWECSLLGKTRRKLNEVVHTTANWLLYDSQSAEIKGRCDL